MGTNVNEEVVDFFVSSGMEDLIYDTTGNKEQEIFESLRNYIERVLYLLFRTVNQITTSSQIRNFLTSIKPSQPTKTK